MFYLSIDSGGTKTLFALFTEQGEKIHEVTTDSVHFMKVGYKTMALNLRNTVNEILVEKKLSADEVVVSFGLAGYGRELLVREEIENHIQLYFSDITYVLHNDIEIALEGAFHGEDGIMLVAGTGSIAYIKHEGEMRRCGGWGYSFGDEGSGYWLAKKMLEVFAKEDDGRLEKTILHYIVMESLNLENGHDLISHVMNTLGNERNQVASLSRILSKAAEAEDPHAIKIFKEAARELSILVKAVSYGIDKPLDVAIYGGVFNAGELILKPLKEFLGEEYTLMKPKNVPEYGAYLLGKKES